jgi:hypothetical protein
MEVRNTAATLALSASLVATNAWSQSFDLFDELEETLSTVAGVVFVTSNAVSVFPNMYLIGRGERSWGWGVSAIVVGAVNLGLSGWMMSDGDSPNDWVLAGAVSSALNIGLGVWDLFLPDRRSRTRVMLLPAAFPARHSTAYGVSLHVMSF